MSSAILMRPKPELTSMEGSAFAAAVLQVPELPLEGLANASLRGPAGTSLSVKQQG